MSWGEPTFERLVAAEPEPLTSSFAVSHSMLLNVSTGPATPFGAMRRLLTDNHEPPRRQRRHIRRAIAIYRVAARRRRRRAARRARRRRADASGSPSTCRPTSPSTSRSSPFALAAHRPARPASRRRTRSTSSRSSRRPSTTRARCSRRRQFKARGEAVAAMKAEGIEYEERMELLERGDATRKPLAELLDAALRGLPPAATRGSPTTRCAPKSVVRDMYERAMTLRRVRRASTGSPAPRASCCATSPTPTGRCARPCPRTRKTEELRRPHRVARRARAPGRLEPARRVGAAAPPGRRRGRVRRRSRSTTRRRRSPPTRGRSGCWSATRCSAGSSSRPARDWDALGELDADAGWDGASAGATRSAPYFDEHDEHRHRRRRPRPGAARRSTSEPGRWRGAPDPRRPRRATTTGASPPRSTWPRPTRPARPCCT